MYVKSKLGFAVACVIIAFFFWAVLFLMPWEKVMYEKSPALNQEEAEERLISVVGYKGAEDISRVHSAEDLEDEDGRRFVVLEIDGKNLEATGIYRRIDEETGRIGQENVNKLEVFFKRTLESYGQFYIAALESGERIPVFINDRVIKVKKRGSIQLPIGQRDYVFVWDMPEFEKYNVYQKYEDDSYYYYIDCATGFARGSEMQDLRFIQQLAPVIIIVGGIAVVMVVFFGSLLIEAVKKPNKMK